jgi:hypothetical protein
LNQKKWEGQTGVGKACKDASLHLQKLKIHVKTQLASKVILFKETMEFKHVINLCYSQQTIALQNRIPSPQTCSMA